MIMRKTHIIKIFIFIAMLAMSSACQPAWEEDLVLRGGGHGKNPGDRTEIEETRKLLLLYSAGKNSLRNYLLDDIKDLKEGWIPGGHRTDDVLLVYTHTPVKSGAYSSPSTPYLIRLYKEDNGTLVADTVITYPEGSISSSAEHFKTVLTDVKSKFPSRSYGMIFSSHATGYLPAGFYTNPSSYRYFRAGTMSYGQNGDLYPIPYTEPEYDPSLPMVKSIGQDVTGSNSYEMDLKDFAEAIPMKLDYILFDACLMGGAEVAFELQGKCGKVGFSQAEVLAEGLDYKTLTKHLLQNTESDPKAVCEDYFTQYDIQSGLYKSATISLVNTDELDPLVSICAELFEKYRDRISQLDINKVQGFGGRKNYFFDLVDVVINAGATEEEIAGLREAADNAMVYRNHTGQYYSATDSRVHEIDPSKFSGLSMFIPSCGGAELNKYYRTLKWNKATELLK